MPYSLKDSLRFTMTFSGWRPVDSRRKQFRDFTLLGGFDKPIPGTPSPDSSPKDRMPAVAILLILLWRFQDHQYLLCPHGLTNLPAWQLRRLVLFQALFDNLGGGLSHVYETPQCPNRHEIIVGSQFIKKLLGLARIMVSRYLVARMVGFDWHCFQAKNRAKAQGVFMDRRGFLKVCATGATVVAVGARVKTLLAEEAPGATTLPTALPTVTDAGTREGDMLYRRLGKTGEKVSLVGLGGYHLGKVKEEAEAVKIARSAIDRGITFMDNSWDYNDGRSEEWMGKALADGYRKKVFLMTKIDGRTKELAAKQLDESLKRLGTDHLDLLQFHEVIRLEDPDRIFADGGALEAVLAAKKAGKVRYIGFTGHKDPLVHLRMLEIAADNDFHFDTVQMPLNVLDAHFRSFAHKVLPVLVKEEIGVLCMKSLAAGVLLESGAVTAAEATRRRASMFLTAMASAFSVPTSTTSFLALVTDVYNNPRWSIM
jgi:aryl-alcohol dehydrogenase-like predicted oxidoreductase